MGAVTFRLAIPLICLAIAADPVVSQFEIHRACGSDPGAGYYGLADTKTQQEEFKPEFIERMRRMEFPELLFLPKQAGIFEVDSMLRLDGVQSVFVPHLQPTQTALSESLCDVVRWQFRSLLTGEMADEYTELREMLLS